MRNSPVIDEVLRAYGMGYFPMADHGDADEFYWYEAQKRGQLPIQGLHIARSLRQTVLRGEFEVRVDSDFEAVIDACAASVKKREKTWINRGIRDLFLELHEAGYAHSVECWRDGAFAGGLYGLAVGAVFCGESMVSRARDASKVALVHLCARLWKGGFKVLDTQLINPHLLQFGAYEISKEAYREHLATTGRQAADFSLTSFPGLGETQLVAEYLAQNRAS